jgi:hypothetical protein
MVWSPSRRIWAALRSSCLLVGSLTLSSLHVATQRSNSCCKGGDPCQYMVILNLIRDANTYIRYGGVGDAIHWKRFRGLPVSKVQSLIDCLLIDAVWSYKFGSQIFSGQDRLHCTEAGTYSRFRKRGTHSQSLVCYQ